MINQSNSHMNVVEVNLNNGEKNNNRMNSNVNYQEINVYSSNKDIDSSGDGFTNPQEENEEEPEQEELSMAEIAHLKKIHEQTLLRSEKYANIYSPQNSDKKPNSKVESSEKINNNNSNTEETNVSNNMLEIFNENDSDHFNEQKINPNKERIFNNIHCYFYLDTEPLIMIGPDLGYFIWIFTLVSFISILIYSFKNSSTFFTMLYVLSYLTFATSYILLMVLNPGIPSEKKHYDINDLNNNYRQCKICNCIYHKDDFKNVFHCNECGICVEGSEHHNNLATKCIGKNNKTIFKIWIYSSVVFALIMFLYLIF